MTKLSRTLSSSNSLKYSEKTCGGAAPPWGPQWGGVGTPTAGPLWDGSGTPIGVAVGPRWDGSGSPLVGHHWDGDGTPGGTLTGVEVGTHRDGEWDPPGGTPIGVEVPPRPPPTSTTL